MRISILVLATVLTALAAACQATAALGEIISLDTLDLANVQQDWGKAQANKSVDGHLLQINGQKFERGVGTHVNSEVSIDLQEPYRVFRASLDKVNRDIVFSFCQYGMGSVWEWGERIGGNSWRTTGDITDSWSSMVGIGFKQVGHEEYAGPGHWNDPDMLVVGKVGWGPQLHPTHLTSNEQITHISLWCLLCSPLLIGCDMADMDPFTLSLLTNDEVLDVSQDPLGNQAARICEAKGLEVWAKKMEDGTEAVGLFNRSRTSASVTAGFDELGLVGKQIVRDLWRQQDLGAFENKFEAKVAPHGAVLVRLRPAP